jgi:hypothetical protein
MTEKGAKIAQNKVQKKTRQNRKIQYSKLVSMNGRMCLSKGTFLHLNTNSPPKRVEERLTSFFYKEIMHISSV